MEESRSLSETLFSDARFVTTYAAFAFAAFAALAFARFAASFALAAGDSFRFGAGFFTGFSCCALAALTAAQRFFVAATIAALPARLSFRLGLATSCGASGSVSPRSFAHLACCAFAIFRLEAAENFLRFLVGDSGVAVSGGPPASIVRSSATCWSIRAFRVSKPSMAAAMISFVSFVGIEMV